MTVLTGSSGPTEIVTMPEIAQKAQKTFKREIAYAMLIYLALFYLWGVWNETALGIAKYLTQPVFLYTAGAMTLDASAKQLGIWENKNGDSQ